MKKLTSVMYYLFVFVIPLIIIYANVDKYLITATESSIEYLQAFLVRLITDESESTLDIKILIIKGVIGYIGYKLTAKFIFDRKLGLSLKERKGDWIITIWQVSINLVIWLIVYNSASFFKVNTTAWLESFNAIIVLVVIGLVAKLSNTYLHYMQNLGIKK